MQLEAPLQLRFLHRQKVHTNKQRRPNAFVGVSSTEGPRATSNDVGGKSSLIFDLFLVDYRDVRSFHII